MSHSVQKSNRELYTKNIQFIFLTILFIATWFYFFASALDKKDWWIENILVLVFCVALLFASRVVTAFSGTLSTLGCVRV